MNSKRIRMQEKLQEGVEQEKIKEVTKRWQETQQKIFAHKRSNKPYSEEWLKRRKEEEKNAR